MLLAPLSRAALGGTAAGGLHAISGPDHLAALLPLCLGRRWYLAAQTGLTWGLGHGLGAALVGALGFALRGALNLASMEAAMEAAVRVSIIRTHSMETPPMEPPLRPPSDPSLVAVTQVGVSIMVIGLTGLQEAREWRDGVQACAVEYPEGAGGDAGACGDGASANGDGAPPAHPPSSPEIVMSEDVCGGGEAPPPDVRRTLLNGVLNGISGTGHVLGVLPGVSS